MTKTNDLTTKNCAESYRDTNCEAGLTAGFIFLTSIGSVIGERKGKETNQAMHKPRNDFIFGKQRIHPEELTVGM